MPRFSSRPLLLFVLLAFSAGGAHALPFGTVWGSADSVIRVTGGSHCEPPGRMCAEASTSLPLADYALDGIAQIFATGSIDHAAGTLSGAVTFANIVGKGSDGELYLHARDQFTLTGGAPGETVSITARLVTDGVLTIQGDRGSAFVEAKLSSHPTSGWDTTNGGIALSTGTQGFFNPPANLLPGVYPFDIEGIDTFDVVTGTPFQLVYALRMHGNIFDAFPAGESGSVGIDALNTAALVFDLPAGYSISSALGYGVPEPAAWTLLAAGLVGLHVAGRPGRSGRRAQSTRQAVGRSGW